MTVDIIFFEYKIGSRYERQIYYQCGPLQTGRVTMALKFDEELINHVFSSIIDQIYIQEYDYTI